ncbi:hypothetical protein [Okeania sp. SIO2C2]|nr:hypothetical protein [Okeania sp. SIO2C2]
MKNKNQDNSFCILKVDHLLDLKNQKFVWLLLRGFHIFTFRD